MKSMALSEIRRRLNVHNRDVTSEQRRDLHGQMRKYTVYPINEGGPTCHHDDKASLIKHMRNIEKIARWRMEDEEERENV